MAWIPWRSVAERIPTNWYLAPLKASSHCSGVAWERSFPGALWGGRRPFLLAPGNYKTQSAQRRRRRCWGNDGAGKKLFPLGHNTKGRDFRPPPRGGHFNSAGPVRCARAVRTRVTGTGRSQRGRCRCCTETGLNLGGTARGPPLPGLPASPSPATPRVRWRRRWRRRWGSSLR